MKTYFVYYTQNLKDIRKGYVGMTIRIKKYMLSGQYKYLGTDKDLLNDIKLLGKDNFLRTNLLSSTDKNEAKFWEGFYVRTLKTHISQGGYNKDFNGGVYPNPVTQKGRKIMSEKKKGTIPANKGKKMSPQENEENRQRNIGRKQSKETIKKRNESLKKVIRTSEWNEHIRLSKLGDKNPMKNHIITKEEHKRRSDSLKGKNKYPRTQEQKDKIRNTLLNKPRFKCEYCDKSFIEYYYNKYHGDNCKQTNI